MIVSIHTDIREKFPKYKFTIRDLNKWVEFIKLNKKITTEPGFRLIGAMNPPEYEGRNVLSPAIRSRMKEMWVEGEFPHKELNRYCLMAAGPVKGDGKYGWDCVEGRL